MNSFAQYQRDKLQEAHRLLATRGELNARGEWRRPTRTTAAARRRLAEIRAEGTVDRRERLARLTAEVAASAATPSVGSVGLRIDPQGRVRLICWEVGQVVVRPAREVAP